MVAKAIVVRKSAALWACGIVAHRSHHYKAHTVLNNGVGFFYYYLLIFRGFYD